MPLATETLRLSTAPEQRNADDPIAEFAREPPQPGALRAEHPGHRSADVGVEQAFAAGIGAEDPHALRFQVAQRAREVGDGDERDRIGGAARRLRDGRIEADGAILRHDHRVRAERIGVAQARAEIVRIGDAVEHQQQRGLGQRLEHVVERDMRHCRIDDRHDALMPVSAGELREPVDRRSRGSDDAPPRPGRRDRACAGRGAPRKHRARVRTRAAAAGGRSPRGSRKANAWRTRVGNADRVARGNNAAPSVA